jgi:methionyl-tRNA formyltransferase
MIAAARDRPLRLAFAGTPDFAVPSLQALLAAGHAVLAVYTQPDRPAGRGRKLQPGPVKACAVEHGLPVCQPPTLRDHTTQQALTALALDALVVVAYGLLLPAPVLAIPRLGCINVHASLLPRWRGAAPIQRALLAGDTRTGVTIMQMERGLDTGPILTSRAVDIAPDETSATLHDRLAPLGAALLVETLSALQHGALTPVAQDAGAATYAEKLHKEEARLDWHAAAGELERRVRGLTPWPVAETLLEGSVLRIRRAVACPGEGAPPGRVVAAGPAGIDVACGRGLLRIQELQVPGRRPVTAADFVNAYAIAERTLG